MPFGKVSVMALSDYILGSGSNYNLNVFIIGVGSLVDIIIPISSLTILQIIFNTLFVKKKSFFFSPNIVCITNIRPVYKQVFFSILFFPLFF